MAAPTAVSFFERLTDLPGPAATPDELRKLNQAFPARYPFLLQSSAPGGALGRFDILFAFPGESLQLKFGGQLTGHCDAGEKGFLAALDSWWQQERIATVDTELPFHGGWFVYLGYELAGEIEPGLELSEDSSLPVAFAVRCPVALVFDHNSGECKLICEKPDCGDREQIQRDLLAVADLPDIATTTEGSVTEEPGSKFTDAVERAKRYIAAGDVYQANLSREWVTQVSPELSSEMIYASLCSANPAPFAGIARWQGTSFISSSPERLVSIRDGEISTRPIAGTRPRSSDSAVDGNLSDELFAHPKERAEHVMLIDLERNDLGRVCEAGSVEVNEMMMLESYAHVHHIVSNVRGRLDADVTPGAAIAAVFPGGTITGCPKVRCMEIISELENTARGAYTGSFGYLNRDGSLDLNILIRTMVKCGNHVTFRAGSGIVADSEPQAELDETRAKAKGMLRALTNG